MTKEEAIKYIQESESTHFVIVPMDKADLESLEPSDEDLTDDQQNEIIRRTAFTMQDDVEGCVGIGSDIYEIMEKYLAIARRNYLREQREIGAALDED